MHECSEHAHLLSPRSVSICSSEKLAQPTPVVKMMPPRASLSDLVERWTLWLSHGSQTSRSGCFMALVSVAGSKNLTVGEISTSRMSCRHDIRNTGGSWHVGTPLANTRGRDLELVVTFYVFSLNVSRSHRHEIGQRTSHVEHSVRR